MTLRIWDVAIRIRIRVMMKMEIEMMMLIQLAPHCRYPDVAVVGM
jgi:hypothetical protein